MKQQQKSNQYDAKWWKTQCPYCQRLRMVLVWGIIMYLLLDWFWF